MTDGHRINPAKETVSPQSVALGRYREAVDILRQDLPPIAEALDRQLDLVNVWFRDIERSAPPNNDQGKSAAIKSGIFVATFALLFPPFHWGGFRGGQNIGLGHSFILSPPSIGNGGAVGSIDGLGLLAILVGIAGITWAATLIRWKS